MEDQLPYFFALGANLFFAFACIIYSDYSRRFSSLWMNLLKSVVACLGFGLTVTLAYEWNPVTALSLSVLYTSGFLGLGIGDLFLLKAFAEIGASRTLLLFGFAPLFTGTIGAVFFDQTIDANKFYAIIFLLALFGHV